MKTLMTLCKKLLLTLLFFVAFSVGFAARVDSVMVPSKVMNKNLPVTVIIPTKHVKKHQALPTVYLLHGYGGWHSNWVIRVPELKALADSFGTIIVCPEGDKNSWYFDSPLQAGSQYETFITKEVTNYIDTHYPTNNSRENRAITGLSMGGHGAFYIGTRHPETFGLIGSMSGGVNLFESNGKYEISQKIGDTTIWNQYSVVQSITAEKALPFQIIFDCGVDDFFIGGNRALHEKLVALKVPHTYIEREGTHNWDFWRQSIRYHLNFFKPRFKSAIK